jgi:hypothetical protein
MNNLPDTRRYRSRAWEHVRASSNRDIHDDFARHLRELVRPLQIAYQRLMSAYGGQPAGVECRLTNRDAWAFVLPDASDEMAWRIQQFDQDGFIGHLCFDTLEAFQTRAGSGVGGETEMRYTGERQRRNDRHGNGACLRRACRRISPLGSMVRDSSATVASSASCIPFER